MAAERNRKHILVPRPPRSESYTTYGRRGPNPPPAPASRAAHAEALRTSLFRAEETGKKRRAAASIEVHGAKPGLYIEFESQPGFELNHTSLSNKKKGIDLVAVTDHGVVSAEAPENRRQCATVFVPDGQLKHFLDRLEKYALGTPKKKGERRHEDMLDRISSIRLATLRALWTDLPDTYPEDDEQIWWEAWLRRHDGRELERLLEFTAAIEAEVSDRRLEFDDRIVTLLRATPRQLAQSIDVLSDLAEVRKAKETAAFFADLSPEDQAGWLSDLQDRTNEAPADAPAVCVLDTGVTRQHPLLESSLASEDCHSVDPAWGPHDDGGGPTMRGHGTEMAGLALWGDLTPVLTSSTTVQLRHRLESVKILPRRGENPPDLYGAVTAEATARPEIQAPRRLRCFSMAVTATDDRDRGQPTSWSAAIDALSAGRIFDPATQGLIYLDRADQRAHRLFVISAGNTSRLESEHLDRSDTETVHDPAQAWNALTVGAYTEKAVIQDPTLEGWQPVAKAGELSPYSTTSVTFAAKWPVKPDVVFEGGNAARQGNEVSAGIDDLSLLTTYHRPSQKLFVTSWATSSASAQAARMAAQILAEYPDYWPETVRALIVHSAEWTRAMQRQLQGAGGKKAREPLIRRYGFGVPSLERALRSADDALTLAVQSQIEPFEKGKMKQMNLHALPWPEDVLAGLGNTPVTLRVTLSYFIEPNPGRRGWEKRHRYASHGLRFEVKNPTESIDEFRKRLNKAALDEEEEKPGTGDSSDWYLGVRARNKGSLHSDLWVGPAADLAERGVIAIYPVGGWWKEQPKRDRSADGARYALVVSIETQATEVDLWTPIALDVGIPIEVAALEAL